MYHERPLADAILSSPGVMRRETFAIRFKTDPVAREFKLKYLEAQERNRLVFAAEQAGVRSPAAAVNVAAAAAAAASLAIPASAQRPAVMRSSLLSPTQATIFEEEAEERSRSSASTPRKQVGEASPMRMSALGGAVKGSPRAGSPRASSSAGVGVGSVAGASAPAMAEVGAVGAVVGVDEEAGEADKGGAEEEGSGQRGGGGRGWALPLLALLLLVGGGTAVAYGRVPAVKAAIDGVCGRGAEGTKLLAARLREVASKLPRRA